MGMFTKALLLASSLCLLSGCHSDQTYEKLEGNNYYSNTEGVCLYRHNDWIWQKDWNALYRSNSGTFLKIDNSTGKYEIRKISKEEAEEDVRKNCGPTEASYLLSTYMGVKINK